MTTESTSNLLTAPEAGGRGDFKAAVLSICTLQPTDGETYYIPLIGRWAGDESVWTVSGGNEDCICLIRCNHVDGKATEHNSIPRWRWEQMVKGGHTKLLKFAL